MVKKILFVFTSVNKTLTGKETGWFLPEAAHPYYILSPEFEIEFASPKGPNPPVDPVSIESYKDDEKFLADPKVQSLFGNAKSLKDLNADDYDAIFYVGGHGPVIDLAVDPANIELATKLYQSGKIVSAVCHGPAALVGVKGTDGKSIFQGRKATAFSCAEEEAFGTVQDVPFVPEAKLRELGAIFEKADEPWGAKVCADGPLLTGQNPASSKPLAELIAQALRA